MSIGKEYQAWLHTHPQMPAHTLQSDGLQVVSFPSVLQREYEKELYYFLPFTTLAHGGQGAWRIEKEHWFRNPKT